MAANSTSALARVLMVAALGVAAVGGAIAIVQPGDLGNGGTTTTDDHAATDDDGDDRDVNGIDAVDDTSPVGVDDGADDDGLGVDDQAVDDASPVTPGDDIALPVDDPMTTSTTAVAPTTTTPGSGLTAEGSAEPRDRSDGLADTGIESMLGLAALLGAAGWVLGRRRS